MSEEEDVEYRVFNAVAGAPDLPISDEEIADVTRLPLATVRRAIHHLATNRLNVKPIELPDGTLTYPQVWLDEVSDPT